jgi:hypothetical protein
MGQYDPKDWRKCIWCGVTQPPKDLQRENSGEALECKDRNRCFEWRVAKRDSALAGARR